MHSVSKKFSSRHTTQVVESTINVNVEDTLLAIAATNPDVIGFSCYIWNIDYIIKLCSSIKKILPNVLIFLGGPEATYDRDRLLENKVADFIICGEGESSFKSLLKSDFNPIGIEGVASSTNVNPAMSQLIDYVNPYSEDYFNALCSRIVYLESSRGCPFSCSFCLSGEGNNVRFFPLKETFENILALSNSGTKTIKFVDRTFNCNEKRALEIINFIKEKVEEGAIPSGITFHCEVGADLFSPAAIKILSTLPAGLFQFEAGLQSFNDDTLTAVRRKTNMEKLINNLSAIASFKNIHLHIDLIAGLPAENYQSFTKGFDKAYDTGADVIQLGFLKLLKGSYLESQQELYNYKATDYPPYQVLSSKDITFCELSRLATAETGVEILLNSGRYKNSVQYILTKSDISPYEFFYRYGEFNNSYFNKTASQEEYARRLFVFAIEQLGVEESVLRDTLVKDKLSTDCSGKLFGFLNVEDDRLKSIKRSVLELDDIGEKMKKGKAAMAVLYTEEKILIADYTILNRATGKYKVMTFDIGEFTNK